MQRWQRILSSRHAVTHVQQGVQLIPDCLHLLLSLPPSPLGPHESKFNRPHDLLICLPDVDDQLAFVPSGAISRQSVTHVE